MPETPWNGPLEASFLFFDGNSKLLMLGAVLHDGGKENTPLEYNNIFFPYGYGIAGRAFKTNSPRLYVAMENSTEPDYYHLETTGIQHKVLISLPVRLPRAPGTGNCEPYGVLSFGSSEADCPLATTNYGPRGHRMEAFQAEMDKNFFKELCLIFLHRN